MIKEKNIAPINGDLNIARKEDSTTNDEIKKNLDIVINKATKDKNSKGKIILGRVSEDVAKRISILLGIDVNNRLHILNDYDIRHMLNEHGDKIKEKKRGQIAITPEDILKIIDIINSYNEIIKGSTTKGVKSIRYVKKYEEGETYMVEVVPQQSKTLTIKTMWKKPTTLTDNQQIPNSTPYNDS